MKPAVLIASTDWDLESWASRMRQRLPGRTVLCAAAGNEHSAASYAGIDYLLAWKPPPGLLGQLPRLKAIFSLGAGVDHILGLPGLPDVPVARIVDADLTARMTEYVVWQVLHHLRRGAAYARQQRAHVWREWEQPAAAQVSVGILGFGHMGRDAAQVLSRLGFPIRGWSRSPQAVEGVATFHGPEGLDAFLVGTDILVALLPLTPQTTGLIDRSLLARLRRTGPLGGPVLINAGRGGCQVEADLIQALRDGTLAAGSLDVFVEEPLKPDSPFWDMENVAVTPHLAAASDPDALAAQIAAQIEAFECGEPLRNVVDRRLGY